MKTFVSAQAKKPGLHGRPEKPGLHGGPKKLILASILAFAFTDAAFAAVRTVTLSVPGMYCEVCPITVKKALVKVPGVSKATVSFEKREAVVTFDDARTSIKALEDATFEAGYESTVKGEKAK